MNDHPNLRENQYIQDILNQPQAARLGLERLELDSLAPMAQALHIGSYDRIVITGLGASLNGTYPAWLHLASAGFPAMWVDTSELIHHYPALIGPKTLLWIASQSGRSAEVVALLNRVGATAVRRRSAGRPDRRDQSPDSPLAEAARSVERSRPGAGLLLTLNAAVEETPSTRTYLLTLAITQLAALGLASDPTNTAGELRRHLDDLSLNSCRD